MRRISAPRAAHRLLAPTVSEKDHAAAAGDDARPYRRSNRRTGRPLRGGAAADVRVAQAEVEPGHGAGGFLDEFLAGARAGVYIDIQGAHIQGAARGHLDAHGDFAVFVDRVVARQGQQAGDALGLGAHFVAVDKAGKGRRADRDENRHDGHGDHQFDQGKAAQAAAGSVRPSLSVCFSHLL